MRFAPFVVLLGLAAFPAFADTFDHPVPGYVFKLHEPEDPETDERHVDAYQTDDETALPAEPAFSFIGQYEFLRDDAAVSSPLLLHADQPVESGIHIENFYHLGTGELLYSAMTHLGVPPISDARMLKDSQGRWLLLHANFCLMPAVEGAPRLLWLDIRATRADAAMHKRYGFALPPALAAQCDQAYGNGCGLRLMVDAAPRYDYATTTLHILLADTPLLSLQLTSDLEPTAAATPFLYAPLISPEAALPEGPVAATPLPKK